MKKLALLGALLISPPAVLADQSQAQLLVEGCAEVGAIYDRRGQQHLYAGVTTSVAEALRAGYCKGVIDQYRRTNSCYKDDWVEQAKAISSESDAYSVSQLLSKSCG
jgi:hypothetical protein